MRIALLAALLAALTLTACSPTTPPPQVATVNVTGPDANLKIDAPTAFTAAALDASGAPVNAQAFTWASSDERVATVSADGVVTAHHLGSVTITATAAGKSGVSREYATYGLEASIGTYRLVTGTPPTTGAGLAVVSRLRGPDLAPLSSWSEITVSGPPGWNGGAPLTVGVAVVSNVLAFAFKFDAAVVPVTGEYTVSASVSGQTYTATVSADAAAALAMPDVTVTTFTTQRLTATWPPVPGAALYGARLETSTLESIKSEVGMTAPGVDFTGLSLTAGATYRLWVNVARYSPNAMRDIKVPLPATADETTLIMNLQL